MFTVGIHILTYSHEKLLTGEWRWQTHTHTHTCLTLILRAHKHTHTSRGASFIALPGALHDTHTSSCVLEIFLMMTHTHPCPRLIALRNTYFSFTFTGAFPLYACGVTRNLRTYFISVRLVFLVETVVLQTVLWYIRAWSARFLVNQKNFNLYFYIITSYLKLF